MRDESRLHLRGTHAMTRDIDDIVDPTRDPVITVRVTPAAVAREVLARIGREVGLNKALVVAEDGAHLPRPTLGNDKITLRRALKHLALGVDDLRYDTEERPRRRAGLELRRTREGRNHNATRLGLPPRVHDRATVVADDTIVPLPGLRVDRLANRSEEPQRRARGLLHRFLASGHQRSDRSRGSVK